MVPKTKGNPIMCSHVPNIPRALFEERKLPFEAVKGTRDGNNREQKGNLIRLGEERRVVSSDAWHVFEAWVLDAANCGTRDLTITSRLSVEQCRGVILSM